MLILSFVCYRVSSYMVDVLSPEQRKLNMSRIHSKDTMPELIVRSLVHRMGFRYSLHNKSLPGKPDLVFAKKAKVIFVNGCFWHMHKCKYGRVRPATNADFWEEKREATKLRDNKNRKELMKQGWKVLIVWECRTRDLNSLSTKLVEFLKDN